MLQAAAAKLEGPCVSYYYVEEREAAMTAEPYTYVWNEVSAVAAVEIVTRRSVARLRSSFTSHVFQHGSWYRQY